MDDTPQFPGDAPPLTVYLRGGNAPIGQPQPTPEGDAPFLLPPEAVAKGKAAAPEGGDDQPFLLPPDALAKGRPAVAAPKSEQEELQDFGRMLTGNDASIDYKTGAPWDLQLALARSDNPQEAAAALERRVGFGNFGQDSRGRWWVAQNGKKVAVKPSGSLGAFATNLGTDVAASAAETAGAVGGGILGSAAGPLGAMGGAGLGAAGGKALDAIVKSATGVERKSLPEEGASLAHEAGLNAALEGAGPALASVGRGAASAFRDFVGTTPVTQRMTERLTAEGAVPPLLSAAPSAKSAQYDQMMRNMLTGDPTEKGNVSYIISRGYDVLRSEGIPDAQVDRMMEEVLNQDSRLSGSEVGRIMHETAQRAEGDLRAEAETADTRARGALNAMEQDLRGFAGGQEGRLGQHVAEAIQTARGDFGQRMSAAYESVDRMAGNRRIVPVTMYRNRARIIQMVYPPNEVPKFIQLLAEAPEDLKLTFKQAHDIRTTMRSIARRQMTNLTPTIRAHHALTAAQDASDALESVADVGDDFDFPGIANDNGLPARAVEALRDVDAEYKLGIAKFYNATMNQLVRDARDGIFPDANVVAANILRPGYSEQAKTILSLLPPELRDQVARADAFNLIRDTVDPKTGHVDGMLLRTLLMDPSRSKLMQMVYPRDVLANIHKLADQLAALNGQLDAKMIQSFSSQGVQQALTTAVNRAAQVKDFAQNNVLRSLANPDPSVVDAAADSLLAGGRENYIEQVRNFLGPESREWRAVQHYAVKKVLHQAVVETPTQAKTIAGREIDDIMRRWTPREQDLLFPNGMKEDLRLLAKDAKFLFPKDAQDMGASLAAASIKSRVPIHIRADIKYLEYKFVGWISNHPAILRLLADAQRRDPEVAKRLSGQIFRSFVNSENTGPGSGAPQ